MGDVLELARARYVAPVPLKAEGVCHIAGCGKPATCVDHRHDDPVTGNGPVRAFLCVRHNTMAQHPDELRAVLALVEATPVGPLYSESCNARVRVYRTANLEEFNARKRARRDANREEANAQARAYRAANLDKIQTRDRAYREANSEKLNAQTRARRAANREEHNAYQRAYHAANIEKLNAQARARYAARKLAAQPSLSIIESEAA